MIANMVNVQLDIIAKGLYLLAKEHNLKMPDDMIEIFDKVLEDNVYNTDITDVVDVLSVFQENIVQDEEYGFKEGGTLLSEQITCSICHKIYNEEDVNIVDYEDDVCINCEENYLNKTGVTI